MKLINTCLIAMIGLAGFSVLPSGEAQAESRFHLNWMLPGFPPPPPRRHYYYYPDAYDDYYDDYDDEVYYYPYYNEEDDYYEPPPRYKPRKKSKATTAYSKPKSESAASPKKKPAAKSTTTAKTAPTTPAAPKTTTASVSCEKAKSIITGYGFGDVQTRSCEGQIYSFAAKRGGKSFSVRVSALSGELTEVKRE